MLFANSKYKRESTLLVIILRPLNYVKSTWVRLHVLPLSSFSEGGSSSTQNQIVAFPYSQITTYTHKDENNKWLIKPFNAESVDDVQFVKHNDLVRLEHTQTRRNLHSHPEKAPLSNRHKQVTGYGEVRAIMPPIIYTYISLWARSAQHTHLNIVYSTITYLKMVSIFRMGWAMRTTFGKLWWSADEKMRRYSRWLASWCSFTICSIVC